MTILPRATIVAMLFSSNVLAAFGASTETAILHIEAGSIAPHFFFSENPMRFIMQTQAANFFHATDYAMIAAFDSHGSRLWERNVPFNIYLDFDAISSNGSLLAVRHSTGAYSESDPCWDVESLDECTAGSIIDGTTGKTLVQGPDIFGSGKLRFSESGNYLMSDGDVTVDEEGNREHKGSTLTSIRDGRRRWSLEKFSGASFMPFDDSFIATSKAILALDGNPLWLWFGAPRRSRPGQAKFWCGEDCIAYFSAFSRDGTRFVVTESICDKPPSQPLFTCGVPERNTVIYMGQWERGRKIISKRELPPAYVATPHFFYFLPDDRLLVLDARTSSLDEWSPDGTKKTTHSLGGDLTFFRFIGGKLYLVTKQASGGYLITSEDGGVFHTSGSSIRKSDECIGLPESIFLVSDSEYLRVDCSKPPISARRWNAQILDIFRGSLVPSSEEKKNP